jgi:hypothetical protein
MNREDIIKGLIVLDGEQYPFYLIENYLEILPGTKEQWFLQRKKLLERLKKLSNFQVENNWIGTRVLDGITNDNKKVQFLVSNSYGNDNGFLTFEVFSYFYINSDQVNEMLTYGIEINDSLLNYFYSPAITQNIYFDENSESIDSVTVKLSKENSISLECGSYTFKNNNINIMLSAYSVLKVMSLNPIESKSELFLTFDKPFNFEETLEVIEHLDNLFKLLSNNKMIGLNDVVVYRINDKGNRESYGKIVFTSKTNNSLNKNKQIIDFKHMYGNIGIFLDNISKKNISYRHLYDNEGDNSIDSARIILNFTAFESEFNAYYGDFSIRSERFENSKLNAIDILKEAKKNINDANSKKDFEEIMRFIKKINVNMEQKLKHAITDNLDIIKPFLKYLYRDQSEGIDSSIAIRMNRMRNDFAHGNLDFEIEPIHVSDIRILEILIYVLILRRMKLSKTITRNSVTKLFGYKFRFKDVLD